MAHAFICDYVRTPIGRYGGGLAIVRADDLGAVPIKALMARNNQVDWVLSMKCVLAVQTKPVKIIEMWLAWLCF